MSNVSDLVVCIKNNLLRYSLTAVIKKNKLSIEILKCLVIEGIVSGFSIKKNSIIIYLKYVNGKSFIKEIFQISKSAFPVYIGKRYSDSFLKLENNSMYIVSTNKGIFCVSKYNLLNYTKGKILLGIS